MVVNAGHWNNAVFVIVWLIPSSLSLVAETVDKSLYFCHCHVTVWLDVSSILNAWFMSWFVSLPAAINIIYFNLFCPLQNLLIWNKTVKHKRIAFCLLIPLIQKEPSSVSEEGHSQCAKIKSIGKRNTIRSFPY